jgi:hypothetical protein
MIIIAMMKIKKGGAVLTAYSTQGLLIYGASGQPAKAPRSGAYA